MSRIRLTKNLFLDEYIPPNIYWKYEPVPHRMIAMLDHRLINADQKLRDLFGPVTINNWWDGGERQWSGIRTPESAYYSMTSQHSWGRASDKIFRDATSEEVRDYIRKSWTELGITCIEDDVEWVHSDVRFIHYQTELLIVKPT